MANSPQARKRARQNEKRDLHNRSLRSAMRTTIKKVLAAIKDSNKDQAQAELKTAAAKIDNLAGKGLLHSNKAARIKSRLNKRVKSVA